MNRKAVAIHPEFFCDGPYYFLTSSSLGGSGLTPEKIANELLQQKSGVLQILEQGVGLPLFFPGDCALDSCTRFVAGALTDEEEQNWVGRIVSKLKVPCGKVVLVCGGGDPDGLAYAISGQAPDKHYHYFDGFELDPGDYLVQVYCYVSSMSFAVDYDGQATEQWYRDNFKDIGIEYLIRFTPLEEAPPLPALGEDVEWCGVFVYKTPADA